MTRLWVEQGGSGQTVLLLLHGLGANASVWRRLLPLIEARWSGRWVAPDLRGHGRSPHEAPYGFGTHAADLASLIAAGERVVALGHSMGGAVAMTLASGWFGVAVDAVIAFGVKLVWTADEIAKAQELARAPSRRFATREEAIERYLRVAGLAGLVDAEDSATALGIAAAEDGFRLAADPRITGVVGVAIESVIAAMRCPLHLAAGERDPMVTAAQMRRFDSDAVIIPGAGHNPHLEAPEQVWALVETALPGLAR
jgi:pimeloyl-ACP methyl ester carboxylesterase